MRRRSCWVCCGLARASSGSASACVALCRQEASSCGYTPLARHHALLAASSIAAVVSTASNRAAAVQARSRAGLDSASLRQRSSVPTPTPTSPATSSNAALSGGNNRATALSLNACPYFANSFSHHRPRFIDCIGATSILTRGGWLDEQLATILPNVLPQKVEPLRDMCDLRLLWRERQPALLHETFNNR